ncbi:unnamed protein product, partial [Clonostachys rhizophaga]
RLRTLRPIGSGGHETSSDEATVESQPPALQPLRLIPQHEPGATSLPSGDQGCSLAHPAPNIQPCPSAMLDPMELSISDMLLVDPSDLANFEQPLLGDCPIYSSDSSGLDIPSFGCPFEPGSTLHPEEPQTQQPTPPTVDSSLLPLWEGSRQRRALLSPRKNYKIKPFSKLRTSGVDNRITTELLLGQLLSYPSMMIGGGRLPPFIFPPCGTGGLAASNKCSSNGLHKCLPESLAICSSLVQSFESRTQGSVEFIWRTILSELERFNHDFQSYSREELLEALQASIVYLLLQASDTDSVKDHDVNLLIETPGELAKRLHNMCEYESNIPIGHSLNRTEWNFRESVRRTICLLYGIELLIDVNLSHTDRASCGGYSLVPLPCSRDLWQPLSNEEWGHRFESQEKTNKMNRLLKLSDLQLSRRAMEPRSPFERSLVDPSSEVTKWSRTLDEFGVLIWMAALLD